MEGRVSKHLQDGALPHPVKRLADVETKNCQRHFPLQNKLCKSVKHEECLTCLSVAAETPADVQR